MQFKYQDKVFQHQLIKDLVQIPDIISTLFQNIPDSFNLYYYDQASDRITISHQQDLKMLIQDHSITNKLIIIEAGQNFKRIHQIKNQQKFQKSQQISDEKPQQIKKQEQLIQKPQQVKQQKKEVINIKEMVDSKGPMKQQKLQIPKSNEIKKVLIQQDIMEAINTVVPSITKKLLKTIAKRQQNIRLTKTKGIVFKTSCYNCKSKNIRGYVYVNLYKNQEILCQKCYINLSIQQPYVIVKKPGDLPLYIKQDQQKRKEAQQIIKKKQQQAIAKKKIKKQRQEKKKLQEELKAKKLLQKKNKNKIAVSNNQEKLPQSVQQKSEEVKIEPINQNSLKEQLEKQKNVPEQIIDIAMEQQQKNGSGQSQQLSTKQKELIEDLNIYYSDSSQQCQQQKQQKTQLLNQSSQQRFKKMVSQYGKIVKQNQLLKLQNSIGKQSILGMQKRQSEQQKLNQKLLERSKLISNILCIGGKGPQHYARFVFEHIDVQIDELVNLAYDHFTSLKE